MHLTSTGVVAVALSALMFGQVALGQQQQVVLQWAPGAEAWAENVAFTYATEAGVQGLADAITAGAVNIFPAELADGHLAVSEPGATPGSPATIFIQHTPDGGLIGPGAVHEWEHLNNNHERLPLGCDPTPQQLQAQACNECAAHCAVLEAMYVRYHETGYKPPCSLKKTVFESALWDCHACSGVYGPPSPNPCNSSSGGVPCTAG